MLPTMLIRDVIDEAMAADGNIMEGALTDVLATYDRDPATEDLSTPFLFFKGYHAVQAHRIANWLWHQDRHTLALFFQSQISVGLDVDIHPAARIGRGILVDHATGIVIGETAVVEDDVSILHAVTLGGTGKETAIVIRRFATGSCWVRAARSSATSRSVPAPRLARAAWCSKTFHPTSPWRAFPPRWWDPRGTRTRPSAWITRFASEVHLRPTSERYLDGINT